MIEEIRIFNRYYARVLGIFNNRYLDVDFTPTEVRIIGEIGRNPGITAKQIAAYLFLDKSYLSRVIRKLSAAEIIQRQRSESDGRTMPLSLTEKGILLHYELDCRANTRIEKQIDKLSDSEKADLVKSMNRIQELLSIDEESFV